MVLYSVIFLKISFWNSIVKEFITLPNVKLDVIIRGVCFGIITDPYLTLIVLCSIQSVMWIRDSADVPISLTGMSSATNPQYTSLSVESFSLSCFRSSLTLTIRAQGSMAFARLDFPYPEGPWMNRQYLPRSMAFGTSSFTQSSKSVSYLKSVCNSLLVVSLTSRATK